jgi:NAD(P)-dependent dehydrogenase (short-subunit alcohol dehydrogenase family)
MSLESAYDFSGKVVIIMGGSRGLGHAMALVFARAGANPRSRSSPNDASTESTLREERF